MHGTNHNAKPNKNNNHSHDLEFGPMKSYTLKIKAQTNTNRFLVGVSCDLLATLVFLLRLFFCVSTLFFNGKIQDMEGCPGCCFASDKCWIAASNCWIDGWLSGRWSWRRTIRLCKANLTLDFDGMLAR